LCHIISTIQKAVHNDFPLNKIIIPTWRMSDVIRAVELEVVTTNVPDSTVAAGTTGMTYDWDI